MSETNELGGGPEDDEVVITVGDLIALLQSADLPNDADVVIAPGGALIDVDPMEYPKYVKVIDTSAVRGYREPSRLILHME